jgi:transcriptional regulator with XRE-family HTH domain
VAERKGDEGAARQRQQLDVAALASALRERRLLHRQSIRQAAAEAGVSFSTWSRVEDGAQPDLSSFLAARSEKRATLLTS